MTGGPADPPGVVGIPGGFWPRNPAWMGSGAAMHRANTLELGLGSGVDAERRAASSTESAWRAPPLRGSSSTSYGHRSTGDSGGKGVSARLPFEHTRRRPQSGYGDARDERAQWEPPRKGTVMPEFMDVHTTMKGVTPEALTDAHNADLAIQDEEHVNFKHAWADPESGMVFCLSEAPNAEAVQRIHERAGHPADNIYQVPVQA
jgi:hypothetical protein